MSATDLDTRSWRAGLGKRLTLAIFIGVAFAFGQVVARRSGADVFLAGFACAWGYFLGWRAGREWLRDRLASLLPSRSAGPS
jgi:hypothetical protein